MSRCEETNGSVTCSRDAGHEPPHRSFTANGVASWGFTEAQLAEAERWTQHLLDDEEFEDAHLVSAADLPEIDLEPVDWEQDDEWDAAAELADDARRGK